MSTFIALVIFLAYMIFSEGRDWINQFKIGYYEQKLENRQVDIKHIKNITLRQIIKKKY